jgi:hypothetical protein
MTFAIKPLEDIVADTASMPLAYTSVRGGSRTIWLPLKEEAVQLLEHYKNHAAHIHHFVHVPTARKILDDVYSQLIREGKCHYNHAALILAMFSSTTYLWHEVWEYVQHSKSLFKDDTDATRCSIEWARSTMDVLDHACWVGTGSIEEIQASIMVLFLLYNMEGFSSRSISNLGRHMALARRLSLHMTDSKREAASRTGTREEIIQLEIRRRTWWHMVATDWALSLMCGPTEGTYSFLPHQMMVNMPRNVNDDDLINKPLDYNPPLSEPTTSSYFLQRIKLAELSRMVTDSVPLALADPMDIDYEKVVALDRKFEAFEHELPYFFQLDEAYAAMSREVHERLPFIAAQRRIIGYTSSTRRLKLHQPFLVRIKLNPQYHYSRDAGLKSARLVINLHRTFQKTKGILLCSDPKFCFVLHHLFWATAVLVMDICYNKTNAADEEERRAEVAAACKMLDVGKEHSGMAKKFLQSLMNILRKHGVRVQPEPQHPRAIQQNTVVSVAECAIPEILTATEMAWVEENAAQTMDGLDFQDQFTQDLDFDKMWSSYIDYGANMDAAEWDKLFTDLGPVKGGL